MRDIFIGRLLELARADEKIMLLTGDLGFKVFDEFRAELPKQFLNVGVAEQNLSGIAAGLAMDGFTVFTYSIGNFPTLRCLEQIRNDICYHELNVNVVCIGGGFSYGQLGFSHHATEDLSIMRSLPGMTAVVPCDDWETAEATTALARKKGPGYLRLDKSTAGNTAQAGEAFKIGQPRMLRPGKDITLVGCGGVVEELLAAHDLLSKDSISARVISVHTLKPLDLSLLTAAARETGGMITVEENVVEGGLGALVAENLLEHGVIPERFFRLGIRSGFVSSVGDQAFLRRKAGVDRDSIVQKVKDMFAQQNAFQKRRAVG